YTDYDQICQTSITRMFEALEYQSDACVKQRAGLALPYTDAFAGANAPTANFARDFSLVLYGTPENNAGTNDMRRALLLGRAILDQFEQSGAQTLINLPTLRNFSGLGDHQVAKLFAVTDRYRRVRPQLNRLIDHYAPRLFDADRQEDGIAVTNLVVWQSEDLIYERFMQSIDRKAEDLLLGLDEISDPGDLLAAWQQDRKTS
ncbi:MAG TPA: hypothetical protein VFL85_01250, partial [Candidatus Saccharimonadales bacterium]|nr:hypothetical protein [Candidatus Saccharimonadales bacterium]